MPSLWIPCATRRTVRGVGVEEAEGEKGEEAEGEGWARRSTIEVWRRVLMMSNLSLSSVLSR